MAEQLELNPAQQPPEAAATSALVPVEVDDEEPKDDPHFSPSGAYIFAMALIIGYAIYLFSMWYEVTIVRGGA